MATKERKTAIDIDDILLREVASRRSASGSVLDMAPGDAPAAALPDEDAAPEPVRESVQEPGREEDAAPEPVRDALREPVREEARPARSRRQGTAPSPYEEVFLRRGVVRERSAVYVSAETKRRLSEVVRRLGWSSISVTTYVENILAHHLELFRGEINRLYRQKNNKDLL